MKNLKPVALVTGASRGIGKAIATKLVRDGYDVALVGRDQVQLASLKKALSDYNTTSEVFLCDLSDKNQISGLVSQVVKHFGRLDVLVNNSGLLIEENILEANLDLWDQALDVNLRACMHLTHLAVPHIKDSKIGAIINVGSTAGYRSYRNGANYCATKHGLRGFSLALFEDLRILGIKVSLIEPGYVNTEMHDPIKEKLDVEKMIQPSDMADAVSYVLGTPPRICPVEMIIMPQVEPRKR